MKTRSILPAFAFLAAFFILQSPSYGASPDLRDILPRGGQAGTEVTVTLTGNYLADAQEIFYYQPGITTKSFKVIDAKKVEAVLAIAPDATLGEHQLRLRTASGASYIHTFWVGPFPSLVEAEPNTTLEEAQAIGMNVTVEGACSSEDVDYYKVAAKKGQRISVEIEALRLGGYRIMFDPYVAVLSKSGEIIAESDDTGLLRQDSALTTIAPADGDYLVEVRDSAYRGSSLYRYRAHIGTFPRPTAVYPAGGKAGGALEVTFLGDAKGPLKQKVTLPAVADVTGGIKAVATQEKLTPPSGNSIRVTSLENVLEVEPNDDVASATATKLALPVAFNGILEKEGDTDYFRFTAKKGQKFRFRAMARAILTPVDTTLAILDAKGKQLSYSDDADGSSDSRLDFTAPADGDYLVRVYDMLKRGGADFVYRVEAEAFTPKLALTMPEQSRRKYQYLKSMVAHRGSRFAAVVNISRANFSGDVAFEVPDLPPGITFKSKVAPKNVSSFPVLFEAAPDAPIGGKLTQLKARVVNDEKLKLEGVFKQEVDLVRGNPNDTLYYSSFNDQIPVVVAEKAPFSIEIVTPKVPIVQNGTLPVKIRTVRDEGFEADIIVRNLWRPPGITCTSYIRMKKDQNEMDYVFTASGTAEARDWDVVVRAEASTKEGMVFLSSDLTPLTVAPSFISGKIDLATVEQGKEVPVKLNLEQLVDFAGKGKLELLGLPANTTAEPVEITKDSAAITFKVKTTADTPKGQHKNLYCILTVTDKAKLPMTHQLAKGGVLRVDPPAAPVATEKKEGEEEKDPKVAGK